MAIYKALLIDKATQNQINLGTSSKKTKTELATIMVNNGKKVVSLFDSHGDFEFNWKKDCKAFEFVSQDGEVIGWVKFERDMSAEYAKKMAYYNEQKAAYEAYQRTL